MNKSIILLIVLIVFSSCSKISPGGSWLHFRTKEVTSKKFDHGPWGGTTEIYWTKGKSEKPFSTKELIRFANNNDWKFVDEKLAGNIINDNEFSYKILKDRFDLQQLNHSNILRFKSDLLTINDSENLSTEKNCFVIINSAENKLTLYYRWGDY